VKTSKFVQFLTLTALGALLGAPSTSPAQNLYVSNNGTLNEYALTTGSPITGFTCPGEYVGFGGLVVSGANLYATNNGSVEEYNSMTGGVVAGFTSTSGLDGPISLTISSDDLYIANSNNDTVGEYDATTGATISGFTSPAGLNTPASIAISPIPEPGTWALIAGGFSLLAASRTFRHKRGKQ